MGSVGISLILSDGSTINKTVVPVFFLTLSSDETFRIGDGFLKKQAFIRKERLDQESVGLVASLVLLLLLCFSFKVLLCLFLHLVGEALLFM